MENLMFVFDPGSKRIYTQMRLRSSLEPQYVGPDEWVCIYDRLTLSQLISSGKVSKDAVLAGYVDALKMQTEALRELCCKGPSSITKERWHDLLEVLYPARWEQVPDQDAEVFMMPECLAGCYYTFGVRIGERYYSVNESEFATASRLIEMCRQHKISLTKVD